MKRVVVTSSNAATYNLEGDGYVITEKDWNVHDPKVVAEEGKDARAGTVYRASKTLAERAAWEFVEKHKGEIKFDLVTILPPWVYGVSRSMISQSWLLTASYSPSFMKVLHLNH